MCTDRCRRKIDVAVAFAGCIFDHWRLYRRGGSIDVDTRIGYAGWVWRRYKEGLSDCGPCVEQ